MKFSLYLISGLVLVTACFTSPVHSKPLRVKMPDSFLLSSGYNEKEVKRKILAEFSRWKGVKYKFGGDSVHGIDCSALMQKIYHSAFGQYLSGKLPRTTEQQLTRGVHAGKHELKAGDLLFFLTGNDERHVGVYIGDSQFIHASTSKGVIISSLTNDYWLKRYKTARRVLV
ncbi:NlpC/P60 family protein [Klebsiella aerogenes]